MLQKMAEEHQMYQNSVLKFQSWLVSKTGELSVLMEREGSPENRLKALQVSMYTSTGRCVSLR